MYGILRNNLTLLAYSYFDFSILVECMEYWHKFEGSYFE